MFHLLIMMLWTFLLFIYHVMHFYTDVDQIGQSKDGSYLHVLYVRVNSLWFSKGWEPQWANIKKLKFPSQSHDVVKFLDKVDTWMMLLTPPWALWNAKLVKDIFVSN